MEVSFYLCKIKALSLFLTNTIILKVLASDLLLLTFSCLNKVLGICDAVVCFSLPSKIQHT